MNILVATVARPQRFILTTVYEDVNTNTVMPAPQTPGFRSRLSPSLPL